MNDALLHLRRRLFRPRLRPARSPASFAIAGTTRSPEKFERAARGRHRAAARSTASAFRPRSATALAESDPSRSSRPRPARPAIRCSRAGRDACSRAACRACAGSAISRPSASMATMAAPGSTRRANAGRCRAARCCASRPSRTGWPSARAPACRLPCCGSPASTGPAATPSSISPTARRGGWSSRARCSTASTSTTSPARSGISRGRDTGGIFNVTDDEPAPPQDVVAYAAELMGIAPPPEIPFETAQLSPMARSFYGENKRVSNAVHQGGRLSLSLSRLPRGLRAHVGRTATGAATARPTRRSPIKPS